MAVSENFKRARGTFVGEINAAFEDAIERDKNVVIGGQMPKYGVAGLTTGLYERFPERFITYSVSEALMNSSAMGLALAGKRVVMLHVRMDFLAPGMDALINHIPVWYKKGFKLPIVICCQIGRGGGQGGQHSKNLMPFFTRFEGWHVVNPKSPQEAHDAMLDAIFGDRPVMYCLHRVLFNETGHAAIDDGDYVGICGASRRHEEEFYGDDQWR